MKFDINKLAALARIKLTTDDHDALAKDLDNILAYVEKLESLTLDEVEPTSHVLNVENVFRDDTVQNVNAARAVLAEQPDERKNGSFFKVPKVIN